MGYVKAVIPEGRSRGSRNEPGLGALRGLRCARSMDPPPGAVGDDVSSGVSNGRLGMMLLVGTETVLFSSFIGAYIVLRAAARSWPPLGVPALTLDLAPLNTAVLVLSSIFMVRKRVVGAFLLGLLFLILQGLEFHRLYARGLTLQSGPYGGLFYTLSACHGLHVLGGLAILAVAARNTAWVDNAELSWHFVTGVWLVLFAVLYLV